MSGGTLLVSGPVRDDFSAIVYDRSFVMTGGTLAAVGAASMAQTAGPTSTQNALLASFGTVAAGGLVHLQTAAGVDLCTLRATRAFSSLAFGSAALTTGQSYELFTGGSCSGAEVDGLYTGGTYTPGVLVASFTVSQRVTVVP